MTSRPWATSVTVWQNVVIRGRRNATRAVTPVWYRAGNSVYQADALDSNAGTASNLSIYELGTDAQPISRIDAVVRTRDRR